MQVHWFTLMSEDNIYQLVPNTIFSVGKYSLSSESNFYGVLRVVSAPTEVK